MRLIEAIVALVESQLQETPLLRLYKMAIDAGDNDGTGEWEPPTEFGRGAIVSIVDKFIRGAGGGTLSLRLGDRLLTPNGAVRADSVLTDATGYPEVPLEWPCPIYTYDATKLHAGVRLDAGNIPAGAHFVLEVLHMSDRAHDLVAKHVHEILWLSLQTATTANKQIAEDKYEAREALVVEYMRAAGGGAVQQFQLFVGDDQVIDPSFNNTTDLPVAFVQPGSFVHLPLAPTEKLHARQVQPTNVTTRLDFLCRRAPLVKARSKR